ncbi:30S ribosomal protein S11 [candidate division WOR-3 bacterium JGI_Cruoil_03_51_56]|uniref:Small ribosomal subunit protein uS11 n=1 Tax=candidate division WOR-3 bacterium JGI_Cruoil_03_51_56 TaxID=1973747 RepID=A0A235BPY3_UNCW3|nr:MAG: 30S ribosomal protein S11 [candidate division WOR-3 bacterium JGI_Cruoil_03_51_56]
MARRPSKKRVPAQCVAHISTTFNNTMVTIADPQGAVVCWSSAGRVGFKGSKKGTPYAAGVCAEAAAREAESMGVRMVEVKINGPGPGREAAVRSLQNAGLDIVAIRDITPIPHNGCRPPKQRRV